MRKLLVVLAFILICSAVGFGLTSAGFWLAGSPPIPPRGHDLLIWAFAGTMLSGILGPPFIIFVDWLFKAD